GVDPNRLVVAILHCHLTLSVGTQPGVLLPPNLRQTTGKQVGVGDWRRHQLGRLVAGKPEHHSLIARALLFLLHPAGDVLRLTLDGDHHAAGVAVESHCAVGVADPADGASNDLRNLGIAGRGDFAGDDCKPSLDQRLDCNPRVHILRDEGIQHSVADLVSNLVGVAFGDGLGSEKKIFGHFLPLRRALQTIRRAPHQSNRSPVPARLAVHHTRKACSSSTPGRLRSRRCRRLGPASNDAGEWVAPLRPPVRAAGAMSVCPSRIRNRGGGPWPTFSSCGRRAGAWATIWKAYRSIRAAKSNYRFIAANGSQACLSGKGSSNRARG